MAIRGIIVAIENYPKAIDIAPSLGNTRRAGDAFYDWLVKDKKVPPANIRYCTDSKGPKRTAGTSREEIIDQFWDIAENYRDQTEELYFFFSGHGFSLADKTEKPADVLIASDFVSRRLSGLACLRLGSLQKKMYYAMGGGHHYYFIDACRNPLNDIQVEDFGRSWGISRDERPCIFNLFSTTRNEKASTSTKFIDSLIAGLQGHGSAKGWVKGNRKKMVVRFDLLLGYLRDQLRNPVAGGNEADVACPGVIAELVPPPTSKCSIEVVNPDTGDLFELKITRGILAPPCKISEPYRIELDLSPEYYDFDVTYLPDPSVPVGRIEPPGLDSIDLYEECEVKFQKGLRPPSAGDINSSLTVRGPIGPQLRFSDLHRGVDSIEGISTTNTSREMRTGIHSIELRERGLMLDRRLIHVTPGKNRRVDFLKTLESQPRRDNLRTINQRLHPLVAGSLPLTASRDLSLWLSLLGAVHLIPDQFIAGLTAKNSSADTGLAPIRDLSPDRSLLYVLLATEDDSTPQVVFGQDGEPVDLAPVDDLVGVWQSQVAADPGPAIFSFKIGEQPSSSVAIHLLPNRATFMTVTKSPTDDVEAHQYLLPVYPVIDDLVKATQPKYLKKIPLSAIRLAWHAQQQFAVRHKVVLTEAEDAEYWANPGNAWVDPMMTLIATYEFIRRGALKRPEVVTAMLPALKAHLNGVPDVEMIAKLTGRRYSKPAFPPIVWDGFAVWQKENLELQISADKLSYSGAWTSWRGTIETQSDRVSISKVRREVFREQGA